MLSVAPPTPASTATFLLLPLLLPGLPPLVRAILLAMSSRLLFPPRRQATNPMSPALFLLLLPLLLPPPPRLLRRTVARSLQVTRLLSLQGFPTQPTNTRLLPPLLYSIAFSSSRRRSSMKQFITSNNKRQSMPPRQGHPPGHLIHSKGIPTRGRAPFQASNNTKRPCPHPNT